MIKYSGCVPLGWSGSGSIQDRPGIMIYQKKADESNLGRIRWFLWYTMISVTLVHWSGSGLSHRNAYLVSPIKGNFLDMVMALGKTHNNLGSLLTEPRFLPDSCSSRWETVRMLLYLFHSHQVVGFTSSGSYSYQLKKSICFAYLPPSLSEPGSRVEVEMLGNKFPAVVVQQPLFDPQPIRAKRW